MIELLPIALSFMILSLIIVGALLAMPLKLLLLKIMLPEGTGYSLGRLIAVTLAEMLILAFSLFVCFASLESHVPPFQNGKWLFLPVVFITTTVLHSCLATYPNLLLLRHRTSESSDLKDQDGRISSAWLLGLTTPTLVVAVMSFAYVSLL